MSTLSTRLEDVPAAHKIFSFITYTKIVVLHSQVADL
jgi:hypothetical protein